MAQAPDLGEYAPIPLNRHLSVPKGDEENKYKMKQGAVEPDSPHGGHDHDHDHDDEPLSPRPATPTVGKVHCSRVRRCFMDLLLSM
jgi:hypothetical protein